MSEPLAKYKSRIAGKNADVYIYPDRVEWSVTKIGRSRSHSSEMMPAKNISSVTSKKSGMMHTEIVLVATGNTVSFRLSHLEADKAKSILHGLILGSSEVAPPNPVSVPAGWHSDPHGRHELRYWDGSSWTKHVSSDGVQQEEEK